jgi:hypothetical protein
MKLLVRWSGFIILLIVFIICLGSRDVVSAVDSRVAQGRITDTYPRLLDLGHSGLGTAWLCGFQREIRSWHGYPQSLRQCGIISCVRRLQDVLDPHTIVATGSAIRQHILSAVRQPVRLNSLFLTSSVNESTD